MIPFCGLVEEFILEFERGRKNCDVTRRRRRSPPHLTASGISGPLGRLSCAAAIAPLRHFNFSSSDNRETNGEVRRSRLARSLES